MAWWLPPRADTPRPHRGPPRFHLCAPSSHQPWGQRLRARGLSHSLLCRGPPWSSQDPGHGRQAGKRLSFPLMQLNSVHTRVCTCSQPGPAEPLEQAGPRSPTAVSQSGHPAFTHRARRQNPPQLVEAVSTRSLSLAINPPSEQTPKTFVYRCVAGSRACARAKWLVVPRFTPQENGGAMLLRGTSTASRRAAPFSEEATAGSHTPQASGSRELINKAASRI